MPEMSENTVHDVANWLLASTRKSLHALSQEIGLSWSTYQRAAKKAGLHAYRFRVVQELNDKCMTYCRWFQTFTDENPGILDYTWFSDEAWFHLSSYVNSQNTRLWGSENPHALFEEPLHSQKVGVFCALSPACTVWGTPPFPESRRVLCVITAANNWAHVLRHNCNKSSVHWTYRRTFPAPPVTTTFHTDMACKCKPTFFRGHLRVGRTV
jgi:hypothetical protein